MHFGNIKWVLIVLVIVGDQNVAKAADSKKIFMAFSESGWMQCPVMLELTHHLPEGIQN